VVVVVVSFFVVVVPFSGRVVVVVVVTSLRGGGEDDEKKKQPDRDKEKKSIAISFCNMGGLTSTCDVAMLSGARKAIFIPLTIPLPMTTDFHSRPGMVQSRLKPLVESGTGFLPPG
jgi:hypothetical protein